MPQYLLIENDSSGSYVAVLWWYTVYPVQLDLVTPIANCTSFYFITCLYLFDSILLDAFPYLYDMFSKFFVCKVAVMCSKIVSGKLVTITDSCNFPLLWNMSPDTPFKMWPPHLTWILICKSSAHWSIGLLV